MSLETRAAGEIVQSMFVFQYPRRVNELENEMLELRYTVEQEFQYPRRVNELGNPSRQRGLIAGSLFQYPRRVNELGNRSRSLYISAFL